MCLCTKHHQRHASRHTHTMGASPSKQRMKSAHCVHLPRPSCQHGEARDARFGRGMMQPFVVMTEIQFPDEDFVPIDARLGEPHSQARASVSANGQQELSGHALGMDVAYVNGTNRLTFTLSRKRGYGMNEDVLVRHHVVLGKYTSNASMVTSSDPAIQVEIDRRPSDGRLVVTVTRRGTGEAEFCIGMFACGDEM